MSEGRPALTLIGAPTSAGAYAPGQEDAPAALREHGLADELRRSGAYVNDAGDTPRWRWRPDPGHPRAQNATAVAEQASAVAERVAAALKAETIPVVLGGDCTIELGTLSGALTAGHDPALVYFDIHPDLNMPESEPDGALDWMGVAHMLGEPNTVHELVELGPRTPLLAPERLVLFGQDPTHSTGWERERIVYHGLHEIRIDAITANPADAARRALELASAEADRYLVHFDVDCIDFVDMPLSENIGRNYGLAFETAMLALDVLLADERLLALTVSELNPHQGAEDGSTVRTFAERLAAAIAGT